MTYLFVDPLLSFLLLLLLLLDEFLSEGICFLPLAYCCFSAGKQLCVTQESFWLSVQDSHKEKPLLI